MYICCIYSLIMITIITDVLVEAMKHKRCCTSKTKNSLPHRILLPPELLRDSTHGEHGLSVQHGEVRQEVLGEPQGLPQDFMVRVVLWGVLEQIL